MTSPGLAEKHRGHELLLLLLIALDGGCFRNECPTVGVSHCTQNSVWVCEEHPNGEFAGSHSEWTTYSCFSSTCVQATENIATCAETPDKDPLCGEAAQARYCRSGELARCSFGYRLSTQGCPANVDWGLANANLCVEPIPFGAICVPQVAQMDPLCAGGSDPKCDGTTLVQCLEGYGVRTACHDCTILPPNYYPRWDCTGAIGYGCSKDTDCAAGLVCVAQPPPAPGFSGGGACAQP